MLSVRGAAPITTEEERATTPHRILDQTECDVELRSELSSDAVGERREIAQCLSETRAGRRRQRSRDEG